MVSQARKQGLESPFKIHKKRAPGTQACEWQGCADDGEFRTAKSPRNATEYVWYCPLHLREHNKAWNYFEGLDDAAVEAIIKNDTVWQRPTWKLGSKPDAAKAKAFADGANIRDDFGILNKESDPRIKHQAERIFQPDTVEAKAFSTLDLAPPVTVDEVKARYKKMARRHHPDANEGSKKSEELFKQIVQAYQVILKYLES